MPKILVKQQAHNKLFLPSAKLVNGIVRHADRSERNEEIPAAQAAQLSQM